MKPPGKLCTFGLDGLLFGIPADRVQEVLRPQPITPLPLAPPAIAGLLNLRGQIIPAIDLRRLLGMALRQDRDPACHLVLCRRSGPVSLLVEEIGDVLEAGEPVVEPPPETLAPRLRQALAGVCPLPGRLLLLLDADQALSSIMSNGG